MNKSMITEKGVEMLERAHAEERTKTASKGKRLVKRVLSVEKHGSLQRGDVLGITGIYSANGNPVCLPLKVGEKITIEHGKLGVLTISIYEYPDDERA